MTKSEVTITELTDQVLDEVERCISRIQFNLESTSRAEPLHAKVLQYLVKRVTTDTDSLALSLRSDGIYILINPVYFMQTLKSSGERSAALRQVENHFFLHHPFREYEFRQQIIENRLEHAQELYWDPVLFRLMASFENQHFISGYEILPTDFTKDEYTQIPLTKASSAEYLYTEVYPLWREMKASMDRAPDFEETSNPAALSELYRLSKRTCTSDCRHWNGELSQSNQVNNDNSLSHLEMELLERETQRILLVAREALDIGELNELPSDLNGQLDGFLARFDLRRTDPAIAKEAEKEVGRLILQFVLKDPFFGHFLSGCIRQVTDTLPTAGVAVLKKFVLLLVNPSFFMTELKDSAERAGVLKHEALHIMLKHIIQMHNPRYSNKRLYNVAADLEVNQYIGKPWKLPEGALHYDKPPFIEFNLPANDVAETYYDLLTKELEALEKEEREEKEKQLSESQPESGTEQSNTDTPKSNSEGDVATDEVSDSDGDSNDGTGSQSDSSTSNKDSKASGNGESDSDDNTPEEGVDPRTAARRKLRDLSQGKGPVGGHSDHGGWSEGGVNQANETERSAHEQDIERMVAGAKDSMGQKGMGKVPGKFLELLEEWEEARRPKLDWKRELRLFASSNPTSTLKRSSRRKSKRYAELQRRSLVGTQLPMDIFLALYRKEPTLFPTVSLKDLPSVIQQQVLEIHPTLTIEVPLVYSDISLYALRLIVETLPDLGWPTWKMVPDSVLLQLRCIRIPLNPKRLPAEIVVRLSREFPKLLPVVSWDTFGEFERRRIQKLYPHLQEPVWGLLPPEEVVRLFESKSELFNLTWADVPPQLVASMPYFGMQSKQPYRIDRVLRKPVSGLRKKRNPARVLVIVDVSGSVTDDDIRRIFTEVDGMVRASSEVHVLQADTKPHLYHPYNGERPISGRGGTDFNAALQWVNDARTGVLTPTPTMVNGNLGTKEKVVQLRVDGVIYLSDGYAGTPTVQPYCKVLWVITPGGTDEYIKQSAQNYSILCLPTDSN